MNPPSARSWHARWTCRAGWVVGAIVLLWGLGWALVPPLLKGQAQKALGEILGRSVVIGKVDFKPWTLELTVQDIRVAAAGVQDVEKPALHLKQVYVDAELQSLFRLAPVVDAVQIDGLALRVAHLGQGRYDFDDIIKRQPAADGRPSDGPTRFALHNVELRDASISFDDRPVGKVHEMKELHFTLPFLSNLPSQREVKVQPRLAFTLNGSSFDSSAEGTPFAQSRKTDMTIRLQKLDLAPYLAYWPATMPVKLRSAVLDADVRVAFEQVNSISVGVSGTVKANGIKLDDYKSRELFAMESISVELAASRLMERDIRIASIELTAPQVALRRDAAGRVDLLPEALAAKGEPAPEPGGAVPRVWKAQIDKIILRSGRASWTDESLKPAAKLGVKEIALEIKDVHWPFLPEKEGGKPASVEVSFALEGVHAGSSRQPASKGAGSFRIHGLASDVDADLTLKVDGLDLALAKDYLGQFLVPQLVGHADVDADLRWAADQQQVKVKKLSIGGLALKADGATPVSLSRIELKDARIDLLARDLSVSSLSLVKPKGNVFRGKGGRWMYEAWTRAQAPAPAQASAQAPAQAQTGWSVSVAEINLVDGDIRFRDELPPKPVAVDMSAIKLQLRNLVPLPRPAAPTAKSPKSAAASLAAKPSEITLSARIAHGSTESGSLGYKGIFSMEALSTQGSVDIARFPVHAFEAYASDLLNIELLRADASFKGDIAYAVEKAPGGSASMRLKVKGDTALEEVRAMSLPASAGGGATQALGAEELLNLKALNLRGLDLTLAPGSALQLDVGQTVLSDFYARIIIDPQGNINLQNLLKANSAPQAASAPAAAASAPVAALPVAIAPSASAARVASGAGPERPRISFGPISLVNGRVQLTDRFVRPNYSAALSELTGRLSAFSSTSSELADLDLRGKAEGTASLEINGKVNPLAQPLALDIKAKVRDLELAPMTPYSVKYAGHGIQRGKLSVDLAYLVKPNGELMATNKLVLNQLTFGDKVEGAPNSLPVRLAVALLADRNGVIDIDLPISGSLNDPEFKLGPIIFKVIVNLVVKAITAPFSLLASAFGGGGDELSQVSFDPGSAKLSDKAQRGLDKIAKALADRPGLKMTVEGGARLEQEGSALRRAGLNAMLIAEKRRQLVLAGVKLDAQADASLEASATEAPTLLSAVYRRSDLPKPLDAAGKAKDLPHGEMEALLLSYIKVDEEVVRELAQARAVAIRDYLGSKQIPLERLFLGAVTVAGGDSNWTPRANLVLATP